MPQKKIAFNLSGLCILLSDIFFSSFKIIQLCQNLSLKEKYQEQGN